MTVRARQPTDLVLERRERLHARLLVDLPSIDPGDIDAILVEARVDRPRTIRELDRYLATNPAGLVAPDSRCPLGIVRLAQVLAGRDMLSFHRLAWSAAAGGCCRIRATPAGSASGVTPPRIW